MDFRKTLAPKKRGTGGPRKSKKKQGKQAVQRILSPEVLPPPPNWEMPAPPNRGPPPPRNPPFSLSPIRSQGMEPQPALFVRSPSERTDIAPTVLLSPRSTVCSPAKLHNRHVNASPPSTPSDASRSTSCAEAEAKRLKFDASEYNNEINRRRGAGLPSPRTSQDVDIPVRFYLVSQYISQRKSLLTFASGQPVWTGLSQER
jgi:hypothetical protein